MALLSTPNFGSCPRGYVFRCNNVYEAVASIVFQHGVRMGAACILMIVSPLLCFVLSVPSDRKGAHASYFEGLHAEIGQAMTGLPFVGK